MEVVQGSNNARYTDKSQGKKEASLTPIDKFEEVAMGEEERPREFRQEKTPRHV